MVILQARHTPNKFGNKGYTAHPADEINYRDFPLRTAMGHKANAAQRWFGFNHFRSVSAITRNCTTAQ